jgi:hypothetical protein
VCIISPSYPPPPLKTGAPIVPHRDAHPGIDEGFALSEVTGAVFCSCGAKWVSELELMRCIGEDDTEEAGGPVESYGRHGSS